MKIQTKLIHTAGSPDPETRAVVPPIAISTIFSMDTPTSHDGFQYGRVHNPTRQILEAAIAELEGARFAAVFTSGSAAITTLLATCKTGDSIVCHEQMYEGTVRILKIFNTFGITTTWIDFNNHEMLKKALNEHPTFAWLETPTNPLLTLVDIKRAVLLVHQAGTKLITDNTFATPILQKPLAAGADVVVESLTKGLSGHSDVIAGSIATNDAALFTRIRFLQQTLGSPLTPFDCFLVLRGLKTATIRIHAQQKSARSVASFLQTHRAVSHIHFPDNQENKQLRIKQMKGPGTLVSFCLKPSHISPEIFLKRLRLITIAHSLGGAETIIQQPTTMMDLSEHHTDHITDSFFRLSLGLEDVRDIITDLGHALAPNNKV